MRTSRAARRYLTFIAFYLVTWNAWSLIVDADEWTYSHLWQIWHPLAFPLVGSFLLAPIIPYMWRVRSLWGGRSSTVGRALGWFFLGIVCWAPIASMILAWHLTCAVWPILQCSYPIGYEPHVSISTPFFNMIYPAFALALWNIGQLVGVDARGMVRRLWIPAVVVLIDLAVALPPGAGLIIPEWTGTTEQWVALMSLVGNVVILSGTVLLASNAQAAAGGMFARPLLTLTGALSILTVADWVSAARVRANIELGGVTIPLYGTAILLMMVMFAQFGRIGESQQSAD